MILEQKLSRAIIRLIICIRRLLFRHVHRVNIFIQLFFFCFAYHRNKQKNCSAAAPVCAKADDFLILKHDVPYRLPTLESMVLPSYVVILSVSAQRCHGYRRFGGHTRARRCHAFSETCPGRRCAVILCWFN